MKKIIPSTLDVIRLQIDQDGNDNASLNYFENLKQRIIDEDQLNPMDLLKITTTFEFITKDAKVLDNRLVENHEKKLDNLNE